MSPFVVTGATGHVGSTVAAELLAQGKSVRVITRDAGRGAALSARGAEVAVGSLDDAAFLTRALDGASGFFAVLPEDPGVADFHGHRRRIAEATAKAVRQSRVPHVVMQSALSAERADRNGPGQDLHYLEGLLRDSGVMVTTNRACYFQENIGMAIGPARGMGIYPNLMASADAPFPTIATRDVGRFAAAALMSPPARSEVVDLLGPAYSVKQMADALGEALGLKLQVLDVPAAAQVPALIQAGLSPAFAEAVAELFAALDAGLIVPRGDRTLMGTTTLGEVLSGMLAATAARA